MTTVQSTVSSDADAIINATNAPTWALAAPDHWETVDQETGELVRFWERTVDQFETATGRLAVIGLCREDRAEVLNLTIRALPDHVCLWIGDEPRYTAAEARRVARALLAAADALDGASGAEHEARGEG